MMVSLQVPRRRPTIRVKRVYDPPAADDGWRVLVDRLWPRGLTKEAARIDAWLKEVAPSPALRQWFGHDPARWAEFVVRYREELSGPEPARALAEIRSRARRGPVTFLFAARDAAHNNAVALAAILRPLASR